MTANREALEANIGTELSNSFDDGRTTAPGENCLGAGGLSAISWSGQALSIESVLLLASLHRC